MEFIFVIEPIVENFVDFTFVIDRFESSHQGKIYKIISFTDLRVQTREESTK